MITAVNVRLIEPIEPDIDVTWTIGTDPGCDVVMTDPYVSARHCIVTLDRGVYRVRDLGSSYGTRVGRTGLDRDSIPRATGHRAWLPGETLWVGQWGIARPPRPRPFEPHVMHFFTADGGLGTWGL
jgi:hypothetical protein